MKWMRQATGRRGSGRFLDYMEGAGFNTTWKRFKVDMRRSGRVRTTRKLWVTGQPVCGRLHDDM